jgi:hypothetical protein
MIVSAASLGVLPENANSYGIRINNASAGFAMDILFPVTGGNAYYRKQIAGAWDATWSKILRGGAVTDITSITGLTTPLSIAQGGTGASTAGGALSNLGGAPLASPTFTGAPAAPTPAVGTNTTQLATAAMVQAEIANKRGWTNWTPTITAGTGSFTSVTASGRYIDIMGIRFWQVTITFTTVGTGTMPSFTLPPGAALAGTTTGMVIGTAREGAVNGKMGVAVMQASLTAASLFGYSGGTDNLATANGAVVTASGSYPIA